MVLLHYNLVPFPQSLVCKMNPNAITFWIFLSSTGYLVGQLFSQGTNGAVCGLIVGTGLTFLSSNLK